jgi:hypothetical protein
MSTRLCNKTETWTSLKYNHLMKGFTYNIKLVNDM